MTAREQDQFLEVVDRDTAERRWWNSLRPKLLEAESVPLAEALGRVLAADLIARIDVPPFDRSNVDGFALQAHDTEGAAEETPRRITVNAEEIGTGRIPDLPLRQRTATPIATGGVVPRGADAVIMVEHTTLDGDSLLVLRPLVPGANITFAGTDIARGERILRRSITLTARETGILAALGVDRVPVIRQPRVAIISTGDEIVAPGHPLRPATIYDANSTLIADALRELGAIPIPLGIVPDDEPAIDRAIDSGLAVADLVLMSGGTSKGSGDLCYRALARRNPGIVVHGVALKPGKPICLGAIENKPVVILPGFPTSAIFTFHEFVTPLIRHLAGRRSAPTETIPARMPFRYNSEIGRTEYLLVNLVAGPDSLSAYPLGKGSGSVTTFSQSDGFVVIPRTVEFLEAGEPVSVIPLGRGLSPSDLVVIGSHCTGIDLLLGLLNDRGFTTKTIWVGSQGGLTAAARGECDLAGIHLLDPTTNTYNRPFLPSGVALIPGYGRMQGFAFRPGDSRFNGCSLSEAIAVALGDDRCHMVNRNRGSGTRILIDRLLSGAKPAGYAVEARSHNAVAAAISQLCADWGLLIAPVAAAYDLAFIPSSEERFDFIVPVDRQNRPAVIAFRELLTTPSVRDILTKSGLLLEASDRHRGERE